MYEQDCDILYISDPGYRSGVAKDIGVERSTVSRTFSSVLDQIVAKSEEWIIPTAIGAVDCTHVHIMKPSEFGDEYVNRKGKTTINVQMTCDANEKITSVDAKWPGSVHDSRIWLNGIRTWCADMMVTFAFLVIADMELLLS